MNFAEAQNLISTDIRAAVDANLETLPATQRTVYYKLFRGSAPDTIDINTDDKKRTTVLIQFLPVTTDQLAFGRRYDNRGSCGVVFLVPKLKDNYSAVTQFADEIKSSFVQRSSASVAKCSPHTRG